MVGREKLNPSGASIVYCFLGGIKSSCSELGWETFDSGRVTSLKPYHIIPWYRVKGLSSESIKTLLPPRSPTSTIGRDMCIESNLDIHSVSQVSQQASYFPTHNIMSRVEEAIMDPGPPFLVVLSDSLLLHPFAFISCEDSSSAMQKCAFRFYCVCPLFCCLSASFWLCASIRSRSNGISIRTPQP